jgi:hypothetical protein
MNSPTTEWWGKILAKLTGVTYLGPLAFWRKLPIVGPLASCTLKNHAEAFSEFIVNLLFGTLTFWGTAVLLIPFASSKGMRFGDLLYETVNSGQLFIFAVGMLGPILLTTSTSEDGERKFPSQRWHLVALILLGVFASGFHSQSLAVRRGSHDYDPNVLFAISAGIAACAVVLRYLAVVTKKSMGTLNVDERIRQPERNFTSDFSARHGGGPQ